MQVSWAVAPTATKPLGKYVAALHPALENVEILFGTSSTQIPWRPVASKTTRHWTLSFCKRLDTNRELLKSTPKDTAAVWSSGNSITQKTTIPPKLITNEPQFTQNCQIPQRKPIKTTFGTHVEAISILCPCSGLATSTWDALGKYIVYCGKSILEVLEVFTMLVMKPAWRRCWIKSGKCCERMLDVYLNTNKAASQKSATSTIMKRTLVSLEH